MAKIVSKSVDELIEEFWEGELNHSRNVRAELLKALDSLRLASYSPVARRSFSSLDMESLNTWYKDTLSLKYDAIFIKENIPEEVRYFLPKWVEDEYLV